MQFHYIVPCSERNQNTDASHRECHSKYHRTSARSIAINAGIIVSFLFATIFASWLIFHCSKFAGTVDYEFHIGRILGLRTAFQHGNFLPEISQSSFNFTGVAEPAFYPFFNIIPLVILTFFTHSVKLVMDFNFSLNTFIALVSSYYACRVTTKRSAPSYAFAIAYGFSFTIMQYSLENFDLGMATAVAVLPLAVLGFVHWEQTSGYRLLALGVSALILCHVLATAMTIILLLALLAINCYRIDKEKWINLAKAIGLCALTTFVFWGRFLKLELLNTIPAPKTGIKNGLKGYPIKKLCRLVNPKLAVKIYSNGVNRPIALTIFAIFGVIVGLITFCWLSRMDKQMYVASLLIILLASNWFPWKALRHNEFFSVIQFPWRLYILPVMMLTYLFVIGLTERLSFHSRAVSYLLAFFIVIGAFGLQAHNQHVFVQKWIRPYAGSQTQQQTYRNFSYAHSHLRKSGIMDYYANPTLKNKNGIYLLDDTTDTTNPPYGAIKQTEGPHSSYQVYPNGIIKGEVHFRDYVLPLAAYRGVPYRITINGHPVSYHIHRGMLAIDKDQIKSDNYVARISVANRFIWIYYLTFVLGIVCFIDPRFYRAKRIRKVIAYIDNFRK